MPEDVTFTSFAEASEFGTLSHPERESVVALNTMLAEDGATLSVAEGVDAGTLVLINLALETEGRSIAFHPRHAIRLAAGAKLTVIELAMGAGRYLHNPGDRDRSRGRRDADGMSGCRTRRSRRSTWRRSTLRSRRAGSMTRSLCPSVRGWRGWNSTARLAGPDAVVHLNAAQMLGGVQHGDVTTVVGA